MTSDLTEALLLMATELGGSEGAAAHFTCGEADSIVAVLAAAGHRDAAVALLVGHACGDGFTGDEDGDAHYAIAQAQEVDGCVGGAAYAAARTYLEGVGG